MNDNVEQEKTNIASNSINIGNHIAGGDIHYTFIQTKVCPKCEEKLLNQGMEICQHCTDKMNEERGKAILGVGFLVFMVITGWLLQPDNFFTKGLQGTEKLKVACSSALVIMAVSFALYCATIAWIKNKFDKG